MLNLILIILTFVSLKDCYSKKDGTNHVNETSEHNDITGESNNSTTNSLDSFPIKRSRRINKYNIEELIYDLPKNISSKKVINVFNENPFLKLNLEIIPNNSPSAFFYVKPKRGNSFKSYFITRTANLIKNDEQFEQLQSSYTIDEDSKNFIAIAYTLDLHPDYDEIFGYGYANSEILIFNRWGEKVFQKRVDGSVIGNAVISNNGMYLVYFYSLQPSWEDSQNISFNVIRLRDNSVVYSEEIKDVVLDLSRVWLNVNNDLISSIIVGKNAGSILFVDSHKDELYKTINSITQLYTVNNLFDNYIEVGFRTKPSEKLFLDKDFIKFKL